MQPQRGLPPPERAAGREEDEQIIDAFQNANHAASRRAEALRWAVGRIRENPAYEQLQQRVNEINELKTQF